MSYNRGGQSGAVALSYGSSSPMPPLSPSRCYSNGSSATRTTSAIGTSTSKFISSSKTGTSLRDRPSLFNSVSSTLPNLGSSYTSNCKSYCHGSYYPSGSTGIRRNYTRPACSPARSVSNYSDTGYSSSVLASNGRSSSSYASRDRTASERTSHVRCSLGSLEPSRPWRHQQTSTFSSDLYGNEERDLTWHSSGRADLSSCSSSSSSSAVASSSLCSRSRRKPAISTVLTTTGHARADSATSSVEVTIADCRENDDRDEDDGDENHDRFEADGGGNKDNYDGNEGDGNDDVNEDGTGDVDEDDEDDDDNQQEDQHNNNNNNDINRIKHDENDFSCGGYERIDYKDERHGSDHDDDNDDDDDDDDDEDDDHSNRNNHHHQQQLRSGRILLHNKRVPSVSPSAIAAVTTATATATAAAAAAAAATAAAATAATAATAIAAAAAAAAAATGDSDSGGSRGSRGGGGGGGVGGVGGGSLGVNLDAFTNLATNLSNTELLINNNGQGDETQVVVQDDFEIDDNNEVIQREVASSETKFRKTSGQDDITTFDSSSFKVGDSEFGVASLYSVLQNGAPGRTNGSRTDEISTPSTSRRQERHLSGVPSPTRQQTVAFQHRATSEQFEGSPTNRSSRSALQGYRDERCGLNGLRNIGNTCFMNSVIQCLSNTRPLLEYVINEKYLSDINTTTSSMKGSLIKAFSQVIHELWQSRADCAVNTIALKSQIQRFTPRFMGYSQQDAQEFLRYLLEGLHEDVNRVTVKPQPVHTDIPDSYTDTQKAAESWKRYLRSENSVIVDLFVGQLRSSLHCTFCNHTSVTLDPFWDLSLPIPARSGTVKLSQCFEHFTREEVLDGDEKPTCSKCQMRRKCTKSFRIQKFPKILVIHLKRFSPMERYRGKLNVMVDFPLTDLDLSAFAASRVQGCTYNLYGVANHSGTTHSGHYTAYCKHPYSGEWHEYNDSHVSTVSARSVVSSEAYVLFYEQQPHYSHL